MGTPILKVRSDLSIFLKKLNMRKSNDDQTPGNTNPPKRRTCTAAEEGLLEYIQSCGSSELVHALKFVHRTGLYNSEISLHKEEKEDFFHVLELIEAIEELALEDKGVI
jgi:hypothetical protein